jgi:hypothetical protein
MVVMLFRFISLILIVAALMLLGADAVGTLESGGDVKLRSLQSVWALFAPAAAASAMEGLPAAVASPVGLLLSLPAWATFGLLGLLIAFLFRHRTDDEEYEG